jgi:hypothetical protein
MVVAATRSLSPSRQVETQSSRLFEARVFACNLERRRAQTAARESPRNRGVGMPWRIAASSAQSQQERQSHLPADRYVRANWLLPAWSAGANIRPRIANR